jgi:sortase A
MVMQDNYYDVLAISETMGYITIPKIDVKLPIYHGTSQDVLEKGVGHLEGSSMPVGGEGTHCVLTGHTGMQNAKLFTDLTELEEGDTFYLHILGRVLAYQVDRITVVEPNELDDLKRVDGEDYCTLVTCTPYGVNSHRLLVRGKRIKYTEKEQAQEDAASKHTLTTQEKMTIIAAAVTTAIMLVLIGITLVVVRRRNKNI